MHHIIEKLIHLLENTSLTNMEKFRGFHTAVEENLAWCALDRSDTVRSDIEQKLRSIYWIAKATAFFDERGVPEEFWMDLVPQYISLYVNFLKCPLLDFRGWDQFEKVHFLPAERTKELVKQGRITEEQRAIWHDIGY